MASSKFAVISPVAETASASAVLGLRRCCDITRPSLPNKATGQPGIRGILGGKRGGPPNGERRATPFAANKQLSAAGNPDRRQGHCRSRLPPHTGLDLPLRRMTVPSGPGPARRHVILMATLHEFEATLTDAAIGMFGSLIGRAYLRARKRLEQTVAASADQGRDRLIRVAGVLEAVSKAARAGGDIAAAVAAVASLDTIDADAALLRRTTRPGRDNAISEIGPEYRTFKRSGPCFLKAFAFEGRNATAPLRAAMTILAELDGDWRTPLPDGVPLGHIERRWQRYVVTDGKIDRTHWELATYSALVGALAAGDIWVPTSRLHRSLETLLTPSADVTPAHVADIPDPHVWLNARAAELDAALLKVARNLPSGDPALFSGDRLRFPKEPRTDLAEQVCASCEPSRCRKGRHRHSPST